MSQNVGQRHIPDNPQAKLCYAVDSALKLMCHTLGNCKNQHAFDPELDSVKVRSNLIDIASEIYVKAYTANKIHVYDEDDKAERLGLQRSTIRLCDSLIATINAAKRIYHLRKNKTEYWIKLTLETRKLLEAWYKADKDRL